MQILPRYRVYMYPARDEQEFEGPGHLGAGGFSFSEPRPICVCRAVSSSCCSSLFRLTSTPSTATRPMLLSSECGSIGIQYCSRVPLSYRCELERSFGWSSGHTLRRVHLWEALGSPQGRPKKANVVLFCTSFGLWQCAAPAFSPHSLLGPRVPLLSLHAPFHWQRHMTGIRSWRRTTLSCRW